MFGFEFLLCEEIVDFLEVSVSEIEKGLAELEEILSTRGLRLQKHAGRIQMTTAPEMADIIERFLGLDATTRLSRAALETLSIIAYQQPITRPAIDSVRGVNSDGVIKSLLSKGLLQEVGRSESPGRPILFGTSPEFLQYFGLTALSELPPLDIPEQEAKDFSLLKG